MWVKAMRLRAIGRCCTALPMLAFAPIGQAADYAVGVMHLKN